MNIMQEMQDNLKMAIKQAVLSAGLAKEEEIPAIVLEQPKDKAHGDYATNMAMQLARIAKKSSTSNCRRDSTEARSNKRIDQKGRNSWSWFY